MPLLLAVATSLVAAPEAVIVQFHGPPTAQRVAQVTRLGGKLRRALSLIDAAAFTIDSARRPAIEKLPSVRAVQPDHAVEQTMDDVTVAMGSPAANSYGWTGKGIGVAVIDSGISWHKDLTDSSGNFRLKYNEVFATEQVMNDAYGHGTHIAGIIGGNGKSSTGSQYTRTFKGIAPDVHFVSLAALDRYGKGSDSAVIAAINKAVTLKSKYNIRIINLSLGRQVSGSYKKDLLCQAVEKAWKAGIVVVVAAGNNGRFAATKGYGTIGAPGNDPYVITVGAMKTMGTGSRADDVIASYSSKGPTRYDFIAKPDIVAPGNKVVSLLSGDGRFRNTNRENCANLTYYMKNANNQPGDIYFWMSGTSMATPVVSGAVALMLQKQPSLTPDQVKLRLMKTASKSFPLETTATDPVSGARYTTRHDLFTVGAGYLDINAALNDTSTSPKAALSPVANYNATTRQVTLSNGTNGTNVIWGDGTSFAYNLVWGTNLIWGDNIVWGDNLVWGDSLNSGFNLIWGSNVIWGDTKVTAETDPLLLKGE